jgi:hypothetical protein
VSNNFGSVQARRNPAHRAKIDDGVAEAEAAGGSPRKKPHGLSPPKKHRGKETFLLRLDRAKATAEHGRTEPLELQGDPDDRADGGRPKKGVLKTTKAPRVTQEDDRDDLDSEEEEVNSKDDDDLYNDNDEELDADGDKAAASSARPLYPASGATDNPKAAAFAVRRARTAKAVAPTAEAPKEGADRDLAWLAASGTADDPEATASAVRCARTARAAARNALAHNKGTDGAHYEGFGDDKAEVSAARRVDTYVQSAAASSAASRAHAASGPTYDPKATASAARRAPTARAAVRTSEAKPSPTRPRGAKRGCSASDWTDGGRPKNSLPKSTGHLDYNDEEPDDGDIKDMSLEDKGETAPRWRAGTHHPQVLTALFGSTEGAGTTTGLVVARRATKADYAPPGCTSNRQAHAPQVPGVPFVALFAPNHEEMGPRGSAAQFLSRHSIGGATNQAFLRSATNRHAHDPKCREPLSWRCLPNPMRKWAHAEALPVLVSAKPPSGASPTAVPLRGRESRLPSFPPGDISLKKRPRPMVF